METIGNTSCCSMDHSHKYEESHQQQRVGGGDDSSSSSSHLLPSRLADLVVRRSISDSVLGRSHLTSRNQSNAVFTMVSRSGSSNVKAMLADIEQRCIAVEQLQQLQWQQPQAQPPIPAPEEECCILAQWAADSYYRIVIAGRGGIPILIRAMKAFSSHQGMQECLLLALGHLCAESPHNIVAVDTAGGTLQMLRAMQNFPSSVAVQSAACNAFRVMMSAGEGEETGTGAGAGAHNTSAGEPDSHTHSSTHSNNYNYSGSFCQQLAGALKHAQTLYLHPSHRIMAQEMLATLEASDQTTSTLTSRAPCSNNKSGLIPEQGHPPEQTR